MTNYYDGEPPPSPVNYDGGGYKQPKKPGPWKRHPVLMTLGVLFILFCLGVAGCTAIIGGAANEAVKNAEGQNIPATVPAQPSKSTTAKPAAPREDFEYSKLTVKSDTGFMKSFKGTIVIKNNTTRTTQYFVQVTVFVGDQDKGSLIGNITVKPGKSGVANLTSLDDFVAGATDYQVEVTPGF